MNRILISILLIITMMEASAVEYENGVEMRPGEAAAERLFESGIGEPWVGGNPPDLGSFDLRFTQFYSIDGSSAHKKHIEAPKKHEIADELPATVYFSYRMEAVPYSQYKAYAGENGLWIRGGTSWTQYARVPQGATLSLLATSSQGGSGYLYEISPAGSLSKSQYYFFPGGSSMSFYAEAVGQYILLYVIGSQVSNSVLIDVVPYPYPAPVSQAQTYPTGLVPTAPLSTSGDSTATIVSQRMRGYQVFLDGNYIGTEGTGGDQPDGRFTFRVVGNQYHEVRVYDGQFNYPKTMFFDRGGTKIIYVEPGTAVYL